MARDNIKNIHFIGIGGIGMSGIALVANAQGLNVSGSDLVKSNITDMLSEAGVKVFIGHDKQNIADGQYKPDVVVVSTAVLDNNPEYIEAKNQDIQIWHRAQMLAYLGRDLKTLAVSGTHGKTSTSSMLASVMDKLGLDPTFLIGGIVREYGTNARCGKGDFYVVEADESDKSFRFLSPYAEIITNIEADHLDHYKDLDEIYEKFTAFMDSVPNDGFLIVGGDDKNLKEIAEKSGKNVFTYGFDAACDCLITNYQTKGVGCQFDLTLPVFKNALSVRDKEITLHCSLLQNPGKHYASNAASVLVLLDVLGFDVAAAAEALSQFRGIKRRFDLIGSAKDITVVDDYAHHSTEIAATVKAACALDFNNVHVIYQPHRYSRIKLFRDVFPEEFARAFDGCATLTFTNVYAACETPIPGVSGKTFLDIVESRAGEKSPEFYYVEDRSKIIDHIISIAKPNDLIITMGAGDVTANAPLIVKKLNNE